MQILDDARSAWRSLQAAPGFVSLAAGTIALGVGLTTGIFSVVNAILLRPLPYADPDRLVAVGKVRGSATTPSGVSEPEVLDWRERVRSFEAIEFTARTEFVLHGEGGTWVTGARASGGLFAALGVQPLRGRTFGPGEDLPGTDRVALISERLWHTHFGGDPNTVGRTIHVSPSGTGEARPFEVVGILSNDTPINYTDPYDVIVPFVFSNVPRASGARRSAELQAIARLAPGASLAEASVEMRSLATALNQEYASSTRDSSIAVRPLHEHTFGGTQRLSMILLGAVGMVLAIATVNLCALLLTRSIRRRQEMAVRVAIGASRARLLGHVVAESGLLALLGGGAGLVIAVWVGGVFAGTAPPTMVRADQVRLDPMVLSFSLLVTVLSTVAASLVPALRATRTGAGEALKGRQTVGSKRRRAFLIATQTCVVTVVLAGAGLLVGSVVKLSRLPLGYDTAHSLALQLIVPAEWLSDAPRRTAFEHEVLARIRGLPGVLDASASSDVPMSTGSRAGVVLEGQTAPQMMSVTAADAHHLSLLKVPVIRGRGIAETDTASAPPVALVNRAFADRYWPGGDVLGRRISVGRTHEVVGVVENIVELTDGISRVRGLVPTSNPAVYVPLEQFRTGRIVYVLIRAASRPRLADLAAQVHASAPGVTIRRIDSLDELVRRASAETRFYAAALTLFAAIGLALAAVGVYGVVAQSVGERVREFGVRIALGSTPGGLFRLVLMQTGAALLIGITAGIAAASQVTWLLGPWLFSVRPTEPVALLSVGVTLVLVGLSAAWYPARTAASIQPSDALRS